MTTSITSLFFSGCPAHISWKIATLIVDPVKRMLFGRRISHIPVKGREGFPPFLPYVDSPVLIIADVLRISRCLRAIFHVNPRTVGAACWLPMSVFPMPFSGKLSLQTSAALRPFSLKAASICSLVISAVASTQPFGVTFSFGALQDQKPSETFSRQIMEGLGHPG